MAGRKRKKSNQKPYHERLAESFIRMIEEGTAPWMKPWKAGAAPSLPRNVKTGRGYRGINAMMLQASQPNDDPRWCTLKQAEELGCRVRDGEEKNGVVIQFWKFDTADQARRNNEIDGQDDANDPDREDDGDKKKKGRRGPVCFYSVVYHASQIEGLPAYVPEEHLIDEAQRHEIADALIENSEAKIFHDQGDRAFYSPMTDTIHLPPPSYFHSMDGYYSVALHEMGHSTGHSSRLDRNLTGGFGSEDYAAEELVAEMCSAQISMEVGIEHDPSRHASYVDAWLQRLRHDPTEILRAARQAQKAANYVLGRDLNHELTITIPEPDVAQPVKPKVWLNVPYEERHEAKALGARWDKTEKSWYAREGVVDLEAFRRWKPKMAQEESLAP